MIRMKALRSFHGYGAGEGRVKRGREFDAHSEQRASEIEAHGLGYRLQVKAATASPNKMLPGAEANKAAQAGPFDSVGGRTGAGVPASSSPPARQPRRRRSNNSAGDLLS